MRSRLVLLPIAVLWGLAAVAANAGGSVYKETRASSPPVAAVGGVDAFHQLLSRSQQLGPVSPRFPVSVLLGLRDPGARQEAADVRAMYDPHSPLFGHYQSPGQMARYGPNRHQVTRFEGTLRREGLHPAWQVGHAWMTVTGPGGAIDRLFQVQVRRYRAPGGTRFVASWRDPRVPKSWRGLVTDAGRISTYPILHNADRPALVPSGGLTPSQLLNAYDIQPLRSLGYTGKGQTIAFLEIDGYNPRDFQAFTQHFQLPGIQPVLVGRPFGKVDGETEMDLEVAHEIAPDARLVIYNERSTNMSAQVSFESSMVAHNVNGIISESLGVCELLLSGHDESKLASVYGQADGLHESVYVSSGDSAAFTCLNDLRQRGVPPSSQLVTISGLTVPTVTSVGGTNLSVQPNGTWYAERAWEDPMRTGGTGGGISQYFARPYYQQAPGTIDRVDNPHTMHSIPDISADADPSTGASLYLGGEWTFGGGTSQAAPIMAGITALINQYLVHRHLPVAGFINPALYALARTAQPYPPYHDITQGTNLWYRATPGYDMASGLGTPDAYNLARDLEAYDRSGHR